MVIEQTVDIPADHQLILNLNLPENLPKGEARVKLSIKPFGKRKQKTFISSMGAMYGCLKDSHAFEGDPIQKIKDLSMAGLKS
jgi:hypothetical protein